MNEPKLFFNYIQGNNLSKVKITSFIYIDLINVGPKLRWKPFIIGYHYFYRIVMSHCYFVCEIFILMSDLRTRKPGVIFQHDFLYVPLYFN
jgi:hypothetical protein